MSEWKQGDVGVNEYGGWIAIFVDGCISPRHPIGAHWHTEMGSFDEVYCEYRRVAVVDLENSDHLDRLCKALVEAMHAAGDMASAANGVHPETVAAALRAFATPKPPRIDEPGVWGVVEAGCVHDPERRKRIRYEDGNWRSLHSFHEDHWADLIDPVLVREGVEG